MSIALEREGHLVAGVVYNPAVDDLFVAERGQGAYLNNRRLRVSGRRQMADCVVGCGIPHLGKRKTQPRFLTEAQAIMGQVSNLRRLGAAALDLCYVAAARYDGYWERDIQSWDMAAGLVIVREAGGTVTDCDGGSDMMTKGSVCVGNEMVHPALLKLLRGASATPSPAPRVASSSA